MYSPVPCLATFSLTGEDWLVILAIQGLVVAILVKMVEKVTEAKLRHAKEIQEREASWQAGCNGQLGSLADLASALLRQSAYLIGLVRFVIDECSIAAAFPRLARTNRRLQATVDKAAAELKLFSAEVTQRQAAAQVLAHQLGDWGSYDYFEAATKLYPDDSELKQCAVFLRHRLQSPSNHSFS